MPRQYTDNVSVNVVKCCRYILMVLTLAGMCWTNSNSDLTMTPDEKSEEVFTIRPAFLLLSID